MNSVIIDGGEYYSCKDVAELWGLSPKTVSKYASPSSGKLRGCKKRDGTWYIPSDAIRPITLPIAQGLIWSLLEIKNSPGMFLDLTEYGISNDQLDAVLDELEAQLYIDPVDHYENPRQRLEAARLTEKALNLVRYRKKFKGSLLEGKLDAGGIQSLFSGVQTVFQIIELCK